MEVRKFYKCRKLYCDNPANGDYSCCSKTCRDKVPTCEIEGCKNAVEADSIYKGMIGPAISYTRKCYNHGGRIAFDGEPQEHLKRYKVDFVRRSEGHPWTLLK